MRTLAVALIAAFLLAGCPEDAKKTAGAATASATAAGDTAPKPSAETKSGDKKDEGGW